VVVPFHAVFIIIILVLSTPAVSEEIEISRYFTHKSLNQEFCTNINLKGSLLHIAKFKHWLNQIVEVPHGKATLEAIITSGHGLTIQHSSVARISAGRTQAPMSENLINGKGESVRIIFDATITERGSHMVFNGKRELIEYTAAENLFHELVHARHKMGGTWRYFDSERQAIEEENIFRRELAEIQGVPSTERVWKTGVPIESVVGLQQESPRPYRVRSNPPFRSTGSMQDGEFREILQ
jgi:hypothetical protein